MVRAPGRASGRALRQASPALLAALLVSGCGLQPERGVEPPEPRAGPTAADTMIADAALPDSAALLGPGVSLALARHRAATLSGVRYDLLIAPRDSARAQGTVVVTLTRTPDAGDLVLDFRGLSLDPLEVNGRPAEGLAWEADHIVIPEALLIPGENRIRLDFTARIAAAGSAIIAYDDPDDGRFLYTLLVPSDAQQLFPVFDQPDLKARLRLRFVAPDHWTVLANGPLERKTPDPAGLGTVWTFEETRPLSPYVMAFAAGPWASVEENPPPGAGPVGPMTLYLRPARLKEADADTLLATNREALEWLEEYFGMDYPFAKLDHLLAPAFPFGGMEHVGAIFYNESRFVFREPPTLSRRLGRTATIYHEVAHQWFGDLVTMTWFDDLWLKEGFSTYMAARMQAELRPGTGAWKTFYLRNKPPAYGVDVTAGTTPVWQELPNLDLAKSNYGPIVYNKAPSILKQLEFLVGEEAFRDGLRYFLRRHAYANATWEDLLRALSQASGVDLSAFGEHYILRAGMPMVEADISMADGVIRSLTLTQRPARALPGDPGGWWPGRIRVRLGYEDREDIVVPVELTGERTVVRSAEGLPAPAFVWPNDADYGYGLFLPDPHSAAWLEANAGTLEEDLLRAMARGALWDLVRAGRLPVQRFVEGALAALPREPDEQIAASLLGRSIYALERYLPPGAEAERLWGEAETLLLTRAENDALDYGQRKESLDALLAGARTASGRRVLRQYLAEERRFGGEPLLQPSRWTAVTRLLALGDPAADSLYRAEQARDTTPEAERMAFIAGAAMPDGSVKADYWRRYFEDEELNEEWVTASLAAFNEPLQAELTLPYLRPALERAEWLRDNRRIFFLPSWLSSFIGGHASAEALAVVDGFLADTPDLAPDVRRRILQARDELERAVQVRRAASP